METRRFNHVRFDNELIASMADRGMVYVSKGVHMTSVEENVERRKWTSED